jgi:hypothetical protein
MHTSRRCTSASPVCGLIQAHPSEQTVRAPARASARPGAAGVPPSFAS